MNVTNKRMRDFSFTSESVTEGHPDKVCDQISDAILDAYLEQDPYSRCAVECLATKDQLVIAGEVSSDGKVNHEELARNVMTDIGYNDSVLGFYSGSRVLDLIHKQAPQLNAIEGAGDQGFVFGYACNQTKELMPLPIVLAHKLTKRLAEVRKQNIIEGLFPDGKSQVTIRYRKNKPVSIERIIISSHHDERYRGSDFKVLKDLIYKEVILKAIPNNLFTKNTKISVNPNGTWFECGGLAADTGLTGRKIIADTYGGWAHHGGGAFSGKDATKVDRSGAYLARYLAKTIVELAYASECEIQLGFEIKNNKIISTNINTFGRENKTNQISGQKLYPDDWLNNIQRTIPEFIDFLELRKPIFRDLCNYGHFGKKGYRWE